VTSLVSSQWDIVLPIELNSYLPNQYNSSGFHIGLFCHSLCISSTDSHRSGDIHHHHHASSCINMQFYLNKFSFHQKLFSDHNSLSISVSPYTRAHHIDTAIKLAEEINRFRPWINLRLEIDMPYVFTVLFDEDATNLYQKLFSHLIKVRYLL
jgi:hypothetical protein